MSLAKRILFSAGKRSVFVPWLWNAAAHAVETLSYLPDRYRRFGWRYHDVSIPLRQNPHSANHNDAALNFFIRLALEHRYDYLIEIGAHTADRSFKLAALFQSIQVYALDVTEEFRCVREVDGVWLAPNSLQSIGRIAGGHAGKRGILCSVATLTCYEPDDFQELMRSAAELSLDIAICEPNTIGEGSLQWSIRRNRMTWYHPYLQTLWKLGYTMPDNGGQQPGDHIANYGDARTYIFAQHPNKCSA